MAQESVEQGAMALASVVASTEHPKPVCQDVQIYPAGEVYIITPTKRFRVFSVALRLSSPVFSRMFDPISPFYEGQLLASSTKDSPASVTLKEDDPEALEVILNIAHFNGHLVPTTLEPEKIFAVALLCDKYDMAKALRGYSLLWMVNLTTDDIKGSCAIRWLAASWAFKNEVLFELVTAYLVKYVKYRLKCPSENGQVEGDGVRKDDKVVLLFYDGTELDTDGVSQKVLDALQEAATTLHESLVSIAIGHAMPYLTTKTVLCKEKAPACDRIQLGAIMRFMFSAGISTLTHGTGQHLPRTPPLISASEFIATFNKEENLSSVLPRANVVTVQPVAQTPRFSLSNADTVPPLRPSGNFKSPFSTMSHLANSGEGTKHTACGILKKVYQDITQRWEGVRGITGLM